MEKIDGIPEGYAIYTLQSTGKQYVAPDSCCLFCNNCTDTIWDYTHGLYMVICGKEFDIDIGMSGQCFGFEKEELT